MSTSVTPHADTSDTWDPGPVERKTRTAERPRDEPPAGPPPTEPSALPDTTAADDPAHHPLEPAAEPAAEPRNPRAVAASYLAAAESRDVAACVLHYAPDATLTFMSGVFEGRAAIEDWHKERFAANMRFVRVDAIKVKADVVTVDAVITSDRLKAWKLSSLGGRATFRVRDGLIKETTFGLRLHNPLEGW